MRLTSVMAALLAACAAVLASTIGNAAPMSDAAYCASLIDRYQKYIVGAYDPDMTTHVHANLDAAVANCQAGNTTAGIPPLEKALRDARFTLPARE